MTLVSHRTGSTTKPFSPRASAARRSSSVRLGNSSEIAKAILLLISAVQFPDNSQAIQGQPRRQDLDYFGFACHDLDQSAGADHLHVGSQFVAEALYQSLHQPNIAKQQAGLQGVGGIAPDGTGRPLDIHAHQLGSRGKQGVGGDANAGGDGPAQVISFGSDGIKGGARAEVDHAGGGALKKLYGGGGYGGGGPPG